MYHLEVQPANGGRKARNAKTEIGEPDKCQVPTVSVQLVHSVRLPSKQSVMADVRLVSERCSDFEGVPTLRAKSHTSRETGCAGGRSSFGLYRRR